VSEMTDREMKDLIASIDKVSSEICAESRRERLAQDYERVWEDFAGAVDELKGPSPKDLDRVLDEVLDWFGMPPERHERLACRADLVETKFAGGAADGTFRGFASVFNEPHETSSFMLPANWKDQVAPGAFTQTLSEHKNRGSMPAMLYMHDLATPIGVWDRLQENEHGLQAEGRLAIKTAKGAEVFELMKLGAVRGLSIGFKPTKFELNEKAKLRTIREVSLFEISPVTIPADSFALVTDVKARRD
jgi:uncharacterized protein